MYSVFYGQNEKGKEKKKMAKNWTLPRWDSNPRFLKQNFTVQDLNFEGD